MGRERMRHCKEAPQTFPVGGSHECPISEDELPALSSPHFLTVWETARSSAWRDLNTPSGRSCYLHFLRSASGEKEVYLSTTERNSRETSRWLSRHRNNTIPHKQLQKLRCNPDLPSSDQRRTL